MKQSEILRCKSANAAHQSECNCPCCPFVPHGGHMMSSMSRLPLARAAIVSLSLPMGAASSSGVLPSLSAACPRGKQRQCAQSL